MRTIARPRRGRRRLVALVAATTALASALSVSASIASSSDSRVTSRSRLVSSEISPTPTVTAESP